MSKRKTIKIDMLKERANNMLKSDYTSIEQREGVMDLMSAVLMEANAYDGFNYLNKFELKDGLKPGINYSDERTMVDGDDRFKNTDRTRVKFY